MADRRAEDRFAEYGVTEPDTNASYYDGRRAEALDELDEEYWAIRDAIRAIDPASINCVEALDRFFSGVVAGAVWPGYWAWSAAEWVRDHD